MPCTKTGLLSNQVSYLPPALHTMPKTGALNSLGNTARSTSNQYCSMAVACVVYRKIPASRMVLSPIAEPHRMSAVEKFISSDDDSSLLPRWYCDGPLAQE